jgi:hypothetical protein
MAVFRTLAAALALSLQTLGAAAFAEEDKSSGNYWHRVCTSEGLGHALCLAYLEGFNNGLNFWNAFGASPLYCLPKSVTMGESSVTMDQIRKVVIRFLDQHPHELHNYFPILVTRALRESFPCPDAPSMAGAGAKQRR